MINKGKPKKKRGHSEIDDIDSNDDRQRLKAFMETSYTDETDSDDENFELNSSDDDDSCFSDASTSDPDDAENDLHNGSEGNATPKKVQTELVACDSNRYSFRFLVSIFSFRRRRRTVRPNQKITMKRTMKWRKVERPIRNEFSIF